MAEYDWTPCEGCYCNHITIYNTETGATFQPICRSYKCEKHGWLHAKRLENALTEYFSTYQYIRMWTFTYTSRLATDPCEHYFTLTQIWKRFITELRRNKLFTKSQQHTQYVRVCEQHQSGYWHFHVLVDRWLDWNIVSVIWQHCCYMEKKATGKLGHVNVKGILTNKKAAKYVSKYVLKSSNTSMKYQKVWTKSAKASIFPPKNPFHPYVAYHHITKAWIGSVPLVDLTCSNIISTSPKSKILRIFNDYFQRE